jgi:lysyl-tRNA synthetase class 1
MQDSATTDLVGLAENAKAWPFEEARRLLKRLQRVDPDRSKTVVFETGYGPSGLPHIGTFGEVARTSMVRHAFEVLTDGGWNTRLICFSDDMDGLRKVPDNIPNGDMLATHLDLPLSAIPNPFESDFESFAAHNNGKLREFLDRFGFDYEFFSATDCYKSGMMDETLLKMLSAYDKVMDIILPTLGAERQATYSPFLPVCPRTGKVLQVPMIARDVDAGTVTYTDPETGGGHHDAGHGWAGQMPVEGGLGDAVGRARCRLRDGGQGPDRLGDAVVADLPRRLAGRRRRASTTNSFWTRRARRSRSRRATGSRSRSGSTYASPESLSLFMFQKPKTAKKLYFDVIPKNVDEYLTFLSKVPDRRNQRSRSPTRVAHSHGASHRKRSVPVSFALMLNLVSASNARRQGNALGVHPAVCAGCQARSHPILDERLTEYAIAYYRQISFCRTKSYRAPTERGAHGARSARCRAGRGARRMRPARQTCRRWSTRRAKPTVSPTTCATGSARSTRCCLDRARGRASAHSSRSTAWTKRAR